MSLIEWFVVVGFMLTSAAHVLVNSFYTPGRPPHYPLLYVHYTTTALFILLVLWHLVGLHRQVYREMAIVAGLVGLVHMLRYGLDYYGSPRSGIPGVVRPVADATANLAVIFYVLAAVAAGSPATRWLSVFFATLFVLRELKYRIIDELYFRSHSQATTSQGGARPSMPREISNLHAVGRFLKSFFYIVAGYALLYLVLPQVEGGAQPIVEIGAEQSHFVAALAFSISALTGGSGEGLSDAAALAVMSEFVVGMVMGFFVILWMFESQQGKREPPAGH